jgi:hypothetical protein
MLLLSICCLLFCIRASMFGDGLQVRSNESAEECSLVIQRLSSLGRIHSAPSPGIVYDSTCMPPIPVLLLTHAHISQPCAYHRFINAPPARNCPLDDTIPRAAKYSPGYITFFEVYIHWRIFGCSGNRVIERAISCRRSVYEAMVGTRLADVSMG